MYSTEIISGEKLHRLLKQVEQEKTILRLYVMGKGFERLTIITGFEKKNGKNFFVVDSPEGLHNQIKKEEVYRLYVEFTDNKKIHYSFKTFLEEINGNNTLVHFPKAVNRLQRRENFRIIPPSGTRVNLIKEEKAFELEVINLSQNGVLIQQSTKNHTSKVFSKGINLKNIELFCPAENGNGYFVIQKAIIRRVEKDIEQGCFYYALQFQEIDKKVEEGLKTLIYDCQREELKKRNMEDIA